MGVQIFILESHTTDAKNIETLTNNPEPFCKHVKQEEENEFLVHTTSIRISQMRKWLMNSNIQVSSPFQYKTNQNVVPLDIQKQREKRIDYYTNNFVDELILDLYFNMEICNERIIYDKKKLDITFSQYMEQNRGTKKIKDLLLEFDNFESIMTYRMIEVRDTEKSICTFNKLKEATYHKILQK